MRFGIKESANVGLHDCRANKISLDGQVVTFSIPDGFYIINDARENYNAEMKCHLINNYPESFTVYIYRKNLFGKIIRENWSDRFVEAINNGEFEFEFVYTYRTYQCILFKGYIWRNKKPWWRECEIELCVDEIAYSWIDR